MQKKRRFFFLEPSKVGSQHITLIEGYLRALMSSVLVKEKLEFFLCASRSTLETLPSSLTSKFTCNPIPVMNPEKRRLIFKTFVELTVVLHYFAKLRSGDLLFVSCVLPTTLWLLEIANRILAKDGVHVVLHGEIEGLFDESLQGFKSYGYWADKWMKSRKSESRLQLVVLDDFIRDGLIEKYPEKINKTNVVVVHHPIVPMHSAKLHSGQNNLSACFIGYRSKFKGYDAFLSLASEHSSIRFFAIGGSVVEDVNAGTIVELSDNDSYQMEIAQCSAALFPYSALYSCSLSAAALDALAAGVPIIAMDRPFFRSLAAYFGSDTVTVCSSLEEFGIELNKVKLVHDCETRESRLDRLSCSKYSISAVQKSFETLVFPSVS